MWFFSDKPKKPDWRLEQVEKETHRQQAIFTKHPIGSIFYYLGIKMHVVNLRQYASGFHGARVFVPSMPAVIKCDYVDAAGVIRQKDFSLCDLERLET